MKIVGAIGLFLLSGLWTPVAARQQVEAAAVLLKHEDLGVVTIGDVEVMAEALGGRQRSVPPAQWILLLRDSDRWQHSEKLFDDPQVRADWQLTEVLEVAQEWYRDLERRSRPDAAAIRAAWPRFRDRFSVPARVRLRQIYVGFEQGEDGNDGEVGGRKRARQRIAAALERIESGESFAEVASDASDSAIRHRGGLVGWVAWDRLRPRVREVVSGLSDGERSEIVELDEGFLLMERLATKPSKPADFERDAAKVRRLLREERRAELLAVLPAASLRQGAGGEWTLVGDSDGDVDGADALAFDVTLPDAAVRRWVETWKPGEPAALQLLADHLVRRWDLARRGLWGDAEQVVALQWKRLEFAHRKRLQRLVDSGVAEPSDDEVRSMWEREQPRRKELRRLEMARYELALAEDRDAVRAFTELVERIRAGEAEWTALVEQAAQTEALELEDLGWHSWESAFPLSPAVDQAFDEAGTAGAVTALRQNGQQLQVLRVVEIRPAGAVSFASAAPPLRRRLTSERIRRARSDFERARVAELLSDG